MPATIRTRITEARRSGYEPAPFEWRDRAGSALQTYGSTAPANRTAQRRRRVDRRVDARRRLQTREGRRSISDRRRALRCRRRTGAAGALRRDGRHPDRSATEIKTGDAGHNRRRTETGNHRRRSKRGHIRAGSPHRHRCAQSRPRSRVHAARAVILAVPNARHLTHPEYRGRPREPPVHLANTQYAACRHPHVIERSRQVRPHRQRGRGLVSERMVGDEIIRRNRRHDAGPKTERRPRRRRHRQPVRARFRVFSRAIRPEFRSSGPEHRDRCRAAARGNGSAACTYRCDRVCVRDPCRCRPCPVAGNQNIDASFARQIRIRLPPDDHPAHDRSARRHVVTRLPFRPRRTRGRLCRSRARNLPRA